MNSPSHPSPNTSTPIHAVLVPGFWLGAWAWAAIEAELNDDAVTTHAVTLPGLDGTGTAGVTLETQVDAVVELVESLHGDVVLVGHSGGGAVVQGVIDRVPGLVRRVIYVDSGPLLDGASLMPDATGDVELPTWDDLERQHSSIEGLDEAMLATFRARAVAEPIGVATAVISVTNPDRLDVPASVICTSFPQAALTEMIDAGIIPSELGSVRDVRFVDLPTGHWPMFSRPIDLAAALREEIRR